jgi:hypothetical protein
MKNQIMLYTIFSLSTILTASAQTAPEEKFKGQYKWERVFLISEPNDTSFTGYRTAEGALRIDLDATSIYSPFELHVKPKKDAKGWGESCKTSLTYSKFENIDSAKLIISKNPFSPMYQFSAQNWKGETSEEGVSLTRIENAPKIINYRIVVYEGNQNPSSVRMHENGYANYIQEVEKELNKQLEAQKHQFNLGAPLELDLSRPALKVFACDLNLNKTQLTVAVDMKAEIHKVPQYNWIEKEELDSLYNELEAKTPPKNKLAAYKVGIQVGQAFQKINSKINLDQNNRDLTILKTLFKKEEKQDSVSYSLISLSNEDLEKKSSELPELQIPKNLEQDLSLEIGVLGKLKIIETDSFEGN